MNDLRDPAGPFVYRGPHSPKERAAFIVRLETFPARLREVAVAMAEEQLDTPYREGGWSARQIVHHLADSHMYNFLRTKFALAEDGARVPPFPATALGALPDSRQAPIALSLDTLDALHPRWVDLWRRMKEEDFRRTYRHASGDTQTTLDEALSRFAWHADHHLAQLGIIGGNPS